MASLSDARTVPVAHYCYDAEDLLVGSGTLTAPLRRYWRSDVVVNALGAGGRLSWPCFGGQQVATVRNDGGPALALLGADSAGSVLVEADTEVRHQRYTPYGYLTSDSTGPRPAYNGELLDEASGCYLLGAGHHRPYSPTLHTFLAPDALSPFEQGGLNAYAYCAGDPVNRIDRSGHFWKWIVAGIGVVASVASFGLLAAPVIAGSAALTASAVAGAALGAVGAAVEVGALVAEATGAETAAKIMGWVGLGMTAVGVAAALPSIAKAAAKGLKLPGPVGRSRGLASIGNPSGGWRTAGHLQLRDASSPVRRPSFRGLVYDARKPGQARSVRFDALPNEEQRTILKIVRQDTDSLQHAVKDGSIYNNHDGLLPVKRPGYYREYTVPDYTTQNRGIRRIVAGGLRRHGPRSLHYTSDHYASFTQVEFPSAWPRHPV